jgi:hypothetical protein
MEAAIIYCHTAGGREVAVPHDRPFPEKEKEKKKEKRSGQNKAEEARKMEYDKGC